jgi:hypothetical protein
MEIFGIIGPDPALAVDEARGTRPLRNVLGVVPVVELVLGRGREIESRDQQSHALVCHCLLLH